jgi:uncharacterized protein (DUF1800 family)
MVRCLACLLILCAPLGGFALDFTEAVHFSERTGFGAPAEEVFRWAGLSRAQAVDLVLQHLSADPTVPAPDWVKPPFERPPGDREHPADQAARQAYNDRKEAKKAELRTWFIEDAVKAPWPLGAKLALFWHNHFTSSLEKLDSGELLLQQDLLFRRLGTGPLGDFIKAVSKDPAMLIYLDGETNAKGKPNENYARELMELFTLGEGNYTEQDVKEAARAFTGWTVDRAKGTASFNPKRYDDGVKTLLGQKGNFGADDVVDVLLRQPRTAVFLTEKFWRFFVSPDPDETQVTRLAAAYRASGYQLKVLLRGLLLQDAFWSSANNDSLVKSPFELLIGQVRTWGLKDYDPKRLTWQLARLGQDLFNPLSVKGWPEGLDWVDAATLLERRRDLSDLTNQFRKSWLTPESNLE